MTISEFDDKWLQPKHVYGLSNEQRAELERDIVAVASALRPLANSTIGWVCPICGGGVSWLTSRCPCVPHVGDVVHAPDTSTCSSPPPPARVWCANEESSK